MGFQYKGKELDTITWVFVGCLFALKAYVFYKALVVFLTSIGAEQPVLVTLWVGLACLVFSIQFDPDK